MHPPVLLCLRHLLPSTSNLKQPPAQVDGIVLIVLLSAGASLDPRGDVLTIAVSCGRLSNRKVLSVARVSIHEDAASRLPQSPCSRNESMFTSMQPFSF